MGKILTGIRKVKKMASEYYKEGIAIFDEIIPPPKKNKAVKKT